MKIEKYLTLVSILLFSTVYSQIDLHSEEKITKRKILRIRSYKPVYFLIGNYTTKINQFPQSNNPNNIVTDTTQLDKTELKFQLSFKTKIFDFSKGGGIWVAYTQSSRWQFYNTEESRPFRETNYEPEIFFTSLIKANLEQKSAYYWGAGINHQSNGRSQPYSRSWNRIILQLGYQSPDFSLALQPWIRWQESSDEDDNPGVENYIGRFDLTSAIRKNRHSASISLRHSLRFKQPNRGSLRFNYFYTIKESLKFHTQIFHGYGESLLDFNHKQTTIGVGLSLVDWLDEF